MANIYNRDYNYTNQMLAADLAKLYSTGKLYPPLQDVPSPYLSGKLNGSRKSSMSHQAYPSQLNSGSALDDLILRQQRGNIIIAARYADLYCRWATFWPVGNQIFSFGDLRFWLLFGLHFKMNQKPNLPKTGLELLQNLFYTSLEPALI